MKTVKKLQITVPKLKKTSVNRRNKGVFRTHSNI